MQRKLFRPLKLAKDRQALGGILSTVVCTAVFAKTTTNARPMRNSKATNVLREPCAYESCLPGSADVQLLRGVVKLPAVRSNVPPRCRSWAFSSEN